MADPLEPDAVSQITETRLNTITASRAPERTPIAAPTEASDDEATETPVTTSSLSLDTETDTSTRTTPVSTATRVRSRTTDDLEETSTTTTEETTSTISTRTRSSAERTRSTSESTSTSTSESSTTESTTTSSSTSTTAKEIVTSIKEERPVSHESPTLVDEPTGKPNKSEDSDSSGKRIGTIVGISLAGLLGAGMIIVLLSYILRWRRKVALNKRTAHLKRVSAIWDLADAPNGGVDASNDKAALPTPAHTDIKRKLSNPFPPRPPKSTKKSASRRGDDLEDGDASVPPVPSISVRGRQDSYNDDMDGASERQSYDDYSANMQREPVQPPFYPPSNTMGGSLPNMTSALPMWGGGGLPNPGCNAMPPMATPPMAMSVPFNPSSSTLANGYGDAPLVRPSLSRQNTFGARFGTGTGTGVPPRSHHFPPARSETLNEYNNPYRDPSVSFR